MCIQHKWRVWYFWKNVSVCMSVYPSAICGAKGKGSTWVSSWTQPQTACLTHSFRQYQNILHCYGGNGLLESFYIQQLRDPELTPCQRELKFNARLLHHHITSLVCMSVVNISGKFIRPTTVFCGTDLLNQTNTRFRSLLAQDLWMNPLYTPWDVLPRYYSDKESTTLN